MDEDGEVITYNIDPFSFSNNRTRPLCFERHVVSQNNTTSPSFHTAVQCGYVWLVDVSIFLGGNKILGNCREYDVMAGCSITM